MKDLIDRFIDACGMIALGTLVLGGVSAVLAVAVILWRAALS